jgi:Protein of unknown function (DUF1501)
MKPISEIRTARSADPWAPYVPGDEASWNLRRVVHLHRRAGFAATWGEIRRDLKDGPRPSLDRVLAGKAATDGVPADFEKSADLLGRTAATSDAPARLKAWWLYRMLFGPDPLASDALKAFLDDLAAAGLADRVAVLLFSEFGRTVAENGSAGTDHGTSGPVFLAGPNVRGGLVGATPSLLDLDPKFGDLRTTIDFRRIYAPILDDWLGLRSEQALGGAFESLPLFLS